jgi:hypothetical protein
MTDGRAFVRCTDVSIEVQQPGACPITRSHLFSAIAEGWLTAPNL